MLLFVKNMVCNRCILAVKQLLNKEEITYDAVTMGEVSLPQKPAAAKMAALKNGFEQLGFEVLGNEKQRQIEKIKALLIAKVQTGEIEEHFSLSEFIGKSLLKEYGALSRLFSEVEGITIEQFFILQKIEKVKEWIIYAEWTLSEIAFRLGYSSVAHLSAQFRKVTGMSPSDFKKIGGHRKSIDGIV